MTEISRRRLIVGGLAAAAWAVAAACARDEDQAVDTRTPEPAGADDQLEPTPACDDGDDPTPEQTEGPYFTPNSPEKRDLTSDVDKGIKLVLTGQVLTTSCQPVRRALLDFWQADDDGNYDNEGFRLRGHQYSDERGRYTLSTIVPGIYPGRTRHIHVKVQAPDGPVLTTQLYFPGEAANTSDGIYSKALVMELSDSGEGRAGEFTFVVRT